MIPREHIASAVVPGGTLLDLYRHGRDFIIALGGNELMSTRVRGSEEALATMTVDRLGPIASPHLLIGGYGMGWTLRAALAVLGKAVRVTIVEIVPDIIDWARGPMADLTGSCLDDPRVALVIGDVGAQIEAASATYDAILLDVDNGPDGLSRDGNDRLYSRRGLQAAKRALKPEGILAVWSAHRDPAFARRLRDAGFTVEEAAVRARIGKDGKGKGAHHVIWFARKPR